MGLSSSIDSMGGGLSQQGVRDFNERLLLTLLQRRGPTSAKDLARLSGLSPPTASSICNRLEHEGLLEKGTPIRGRVGKPSTPVALAPFGLVSFGVTIRRRCTEVILVNFVGEVQDCRQLDYTAPTPEAVFPFLAKSIQEITSALDARLRSKILGIGVSAPFEILHGNISSVDDVVDLRAWAGVQLEDELNKRLPHAVLLANDATAACHAEHVLGRGREFTDYAYFFIGLQLGGGVVLNNSVYHGKRGNAGALGSLRTVSSIGESKKLAETASIQLLEQRLAESDIDPSVLLNDYSSWLDLDRYVDPWIGQIAQEIARASASVCSIIDFEAILIDGSFPENIRGRIVDRTQRYLKNQDLSGLFAPQIESATIGRNAQSIGAAYLPILSAYFDHSMLVSSQGSK